jgi:RNA polymerase sigma factor (sigma-70 family)
VSDQDWLASRFEVHRGHLRAVALRMLGSPSEAEDAVQEAWLRLTRADAGKVDNLGGWLTTVVSRVCLDMLRTRTSRREQPLQPETAEFPGGDANREDPEQEALVADSVGPALMVVLDTLTPPQRVAFVLHDLFAIPYEDIATVLGRSPAATRMLASRARKRVQAESPPDADIIRQHDLVQAFLLASRRGDFTALLEVLDPDVTLRADAAASPAGTPTHTRGAHNVAKGALAFSRLARTARTALVDGCIGIVSVSGGRVRTVLTFALDNDRIAEIDVIADRTQLAHLDVRLINQ